MKILDFYLESWQLKCSKKGEKNVETIKLFCFCVWLGLEKIKEKNTTYYLLAMLVVVGAQHSVRTLSFFRLFAKVQVF